VEDVREYARQFELPVEWADSSVAKEFGAAEVPATVLLRNGRVQAIYFSQREPDVWRSLLTPK
jgi:hypothetical protein